jgi:DNA-binding HxlR family transcriptional regulator
MPVAGRIEPCDQPLGRAGPGRAAGRDHGQGGAQRFSQLRKEVGGVSEKMLAQTLVALEGDGFVLRTALPVIPPHVEYSLTPLGREVAERLEVLVDWIEDNLPRIVAPGGEAVASL